MEPDRLVARRMDRVCLTVRGDEARQWLQGQLTADVAEPAPGEARYALVVNDKGRVFSDVYVLDRDDGVDLLVPSDRGAPLLERLDRFIVMEDVELALEERAFWVAAGPGADALPGSAVRALGGVGTIGEGADFEAHRVDDAEWERLRIAAGEPRFGADFGEHTLPQEAGLRHAVSFEKGCYVGQEPIVMLEHRGKPPKRLVRGTSAQATVDMPVMQGGREVGRVTSAAGGLVLALVKRKALETEAPLEIGGSPLEGLALIGSDET